MYRGKDSNLHAQSAPDPKSGVSPSVNLVMQVYM
ncbi:uncharacterized protein METZ01_LOCUS431120 [marine metagenome]|uniref:Uncharacterized protein n=1 Tax=marine metagenome TaxID=408172 RepID=A0A382Y4N6_9ZZZZ